MRPSWACPARLERAWAPSRPRQAARPCKGINSRKPIATGREKRPTTSRPNWCQSERGSRVTATWINSTASRARKPLVQRAPVKANNQKGSASLGGKSGRPTVKTKTSSSTTAVPLASDANRSGSAGGTKEFIGMDQEEPNSSLEENKRSPSQNYTPHLRPARLVIIAAPYFDQGSLYSPEASPTGLGLRPSRQSLLQD